MIDFVTTPRSINKTDAVSLVSQFGSLRTAVNARHEDVAGIAGWGDKKVRAWTGAVREGFRTERAKKRRVGERSLPLIGAEESLGSTAATSREGSRPASAMDRPGSGGEQRPVNGRDHAPIRAVGPFQIDQDEDGEEALAALNAAETGPSKTTVREEAAEAPRKRKPDDDPLSDGVMAALSKLRKDGG